ncbi:TIM-barrel domain-containing protein [Paenibacillus sp. Soil787]|uniref:glycoside hydrolase family 31 protein n=1 Tax=Paenibacillus sp. Soil787 TaxID=1736411 RepID=UPI00070305ED|nr:TIM-barrel domain-containing protein [Paenibacillus sp. Soil787]KRF18431.1 ABC transporter substrate-binding protein [Paenibacillus sp. Soil787]
MTSTLKWTEHVPGIWKTTIGNPSELSPLNFIGSEPKREALKQMGEIGFPFGSDDFTLEQKNHGTLFSTPLTTDEKLYGLGLQFMKMNQRGRTRYLRVNSDPKQDTGESHAPIPFVVSDQGYGILIDTSRIVTVHLGSTVRLAETRKEQIFDRNNQKGLWKATPTSERMEFLLPSEGADVYVIAGNNLLDVVRRYNLLCGGGTLPPRWGLGFWHRVPTLFTDKEVMEEALEYRKREFPCDVIGLEPGWHSKSYPVTYEWCESRYPDPEHFVAKMDQEGFRINLWENPYVSPESGLYEKLGKLSGSYSVWGGLVPDYSLEEARDAYKEQHRREHLSIGVSGYKLDECDGSELTGNSWMFPAHAEFPSGHDGEQMRQMYGLMFQKMTTELYREENKRTYGLLRASGAGASSMPYVLYSDLYDHRQFIRALCNGSFSGLLWTPEVRKSASVEDWVRRLQSVCFSPLAMLDAWADGTKPWSFPEVEHIVRHYIQLRMRLLPYLYTAFAKYHQDGTPPFRAMPLVTGSVQFDGGKATAMKVDSVDFAYGGNKKKEWDDQFMVGDSLLVAPLFAGEQARDVYLPQGRWYGLENGEAYEGGSVVRVAPGIEQIPVFVREGAVIPMMPWRAYAPRQGEQVPLILGHFGEVEGSCSLYDDDGESFAFERGESVWRKAEVRRSADGSWTGTLTGHEASFPSTFSEVQWHFGLKKLP